MGMKKCIMCKSKVVGRSDKKYCSIKCKSNYHRKLSEVTNIATQRIDKILHRNRSILLEVMGENKLQTKISIDVLEKKKFSFNYITKYYINSKGKTYHHVYDFSWMTFSDNEVLIIRR
jgi:hypothetical protein